jgi:hypothetical protein
LQSRERAEREAGGAEIEAAKGYHEQSKKLALPLLTRFSAVYSKTNERLNKLLSRSFKIAFSGESAFSSKQPKQVLNELRRIYAINLQGLLTPYYGQR